MGRVSCSSHSTETSFACGATPLEKHVNVVISQTVAMLADDTHSLNARFQRHTNLSHFRVLSERTLEMRVGVLLPCLGVLGVQSN